MPTYNIPVENAISDLIDKDDLSSAQKTEAIMDQIRQCNEEEIIKQLKKMNTYLAIMVGSDLDN